MIVIDEENKVSKWLDSFKSEEIGFARIDLATFEIANGFETELVLIQDTVYHQMNPIVKNKLSEVAAILVFNSTGQDLQFLLDKVVGILNEESNKQLVQNQIILLEDQLKNTTILKSQLMTINKEFLKTMGSVEKQLLRVKKSYELKAPKRLENFKGFTVFSKYAAGEDMGGEFFDVFAKEGKIFMLMSANSSYIASSSILEYFGELKSHPVINSALEEDFINNIRSELKKINSNKTKPVKTQLLTCILDINTLKIEGHMFGDFQVMSSNLRQSVSVNNSLEGNNENSFFELQLERGERILLNSPGFINNWDTSRPTFMIEELVTNPKMKALDVLDEVYFQLKKKSSNGFLTHDASSIILEVQENVMLKV